MKREEAISVINKAAEDSKAFLELLKKHKSKDPFNITEFLQSLSKKQHSVVWESLLRLLLENVEVKEVESGENSPPTSAGLVSDKSLLLVSGVVEFCSCALSLEDPVTPEPMQEALQVLHDNLLTLFEPTPQLQNRACQLLERWWCLEKGERDGLVPHCLLYLVARTLNEGAKVSDVKRVWVMRKAFLLLDFEDPGTSPFKTMLLACILQHVYLNSDQGRKFLSFLFGMHPKFVEDLHQTIKNQIPRAPKSLLEIYAEIYFRAWKLSSGPYLLQIEEHCLQDLMYSAVHAPRNGFCLFQSLRKILSFIHQQRSQKGVSEMLLRLYSPFLWRSLKVACPQVRANAASLLLDAFPLQDPDSTREEIDTIMQKQFDVMMELLGDQSVLVRVTAVSGVCHVLSLYFEMIPFPAIKTLLGRLVKELAWDAAAIDVRVAVLQGLCVILGNHMTHSLLKELLPLLHPFLHDNSEKVRLAFLELLLLVKGMKSLKFWNICPIEHLLARMEMDSIHVVKRIVSLLMDAFKYSSSQKIQRCLSLLRMNPGAARRFYQLAGTLLSPGDVVHLILAIQSALLQCIQSKGVENSTATVNGVDPGSDDGNKAIPKTRKRGKQWKSESPTPDTALSQEMIDRSEMEEPLSLQDFDLVCGLLDVMAVLWEVVKDRLDKPTHRKVKKNLISKTAQNLPLFFDTFTEGTSRSTLYLLASHLPRQSVAPIARGTLQALSSLQYLSSKTHDHTSLLVALVSWQQTNDVLQLVSRWLSPYLNSVEHNGVAEAVESHPSKTGRKKTKRSGSKHATAKNDVTEIAPLDMPRPLLALDMLSWMMCHPICLQELKKAEKFWDLVGLFKKSLDLLSLHFSSAQSSRPVPFELLKKAFSLYLRMCVHRRVRGIGGRATKDEEGEEAWLIEEMKDIQQWCTDVLLPPLTETTSSAASSRRRSSRKRKASQSCPPAPPSLARTQAEELTRDLLSLFSEMLLIGIAQDSLLQNQMAQIASNFAATNSGQLFLPSLCKLLFQLCEVSSHQEVEGIAVGPGALTPTATLLDSLLTLLNKISVENQAAFTKAWNNSVRQCVSAVIVTSLRTTSLSLSPHPLETYSILVKTLIQAQLDHIKTNSNIKLPSSSDDLPTFIGYVLKHACRETQSVCLFGNHLCDYLNEVEPLDVSQKLLVHISSLYLIHVIHTLSRGKHGGEELMHCMRFSMKFLDGLDEENNQRSKELILEMKTLLETVQEKFYTR